MVLTPKWSCYGTDNKVIGRTWPKEDFLQQLQNFSELSGDRLTSPEHWWPIPNIPNISRLRRDRIVFDSLGRKRFQVWWEKAGLLSFRVGWLADGGGHTVVDTLGWFSDGRRFHISFQYSHNQTSYQCPHFLHPSFFSFFFFQSTSLSNAWTVSLLLSIPFNFHPSVHQPDAFTNVRW